MAAVACLPVFFVAALLLSFVFPASATLTLSANTYDRNGQFVTVSWAGITGVQESDTIALIQTVPGDLQTR